MYVYTLCYLSINVTEWVAEFLRIIISIARDACA